MYNISHIKHIFYINRNENILNIKPTDIIPTVTIATNTIISFLFTAFDSIIIDGKDNVVTAKQFQALPPLTIDFLLQELFQIYQHT